MVLFLGIDVGGSAIKQAVAELPVLASPQPATPAAVTDVIAELRLGAGRGLGGVVMVLTFVDGRLLPNTELGHLPVHGSRSPRSAP